ncbi:MAG: hypothetical protein KDA45_10975 [Planctomycetales bacterium]|nr:hypothetical protein [Planctomycetales bacterium]
MSEAFYKKPIAGLLLLAGAAGGPYMMFETETGRQASQGASYWLGGTSGAGQSEASQQQDSPPPAGKPVSIAMLDNPLNTASAGKSLESPAIHSLREVLRFDIAPGWVLQQFPRVSTVLADTQLDGLRVPLITGTTPSDIAGTLTYYFDRYKRLQRVTIHGVTGDPTRFVAELQQLYEMQQVPSLGGVLYMLRWNGRATSVVHIEPASVIYADALYSRYSLLIELNQAGMEYGLSSEAQQLIDSGKSRQRW